MSNPAREWAERARKAQGAVNEPGAGPPASGLTDDERRTRAWAREVFTLPPDGNCGYAGMDDPDGAARYVLGRAKALLRQQAAIIARLSGEEDPVLTPEQERRRAFRAGLRGGE